jgi:threonine aldolase
MIKLGFLSDNTAPAAPDFVRAITIANEGYDASYGDDIWTARLQTTAQHVFERTESVTAFPVLNGKAANHLSLLAATEPGGIVFCHECAHLMIDENDGPQRYTQARFIGLADDGGGKIAPETLRQAIDAAGPISARSAFCLTNVTERGSVYTAAEIAELAAIAHDSDLTVHLDGARIANAAVALNASLADLTWRAGVDTVSMGLTKNGGLSAEAVVSFDDLTTSRFLEARDWTGHVPSKMRFLSVQAVIGLEGRDWKVRARNANEMAKLLAEGLAVLDGVEILQPVEANLIFVDLSPERRAKFDAAGYMAESRPDLGPNVIRLVTNWCTIPTDVRQLLAALAD